MTKEDLHKKCYQTISGEMKRFLTNPKNYRVVRISKTELQQINSYIVRQIQMSSNYRVETYFTSVYAVWNGQDEFRSLQIQYAQLSEKNRALEQQVDTLNQETKKQKETIDKCIQCIMGTAN